MRHCWAAVIQLLATALVLPCLYARSCLADERPLGNMFRAVVTNVNTNSDDNTSADVATTKTTVFDSHQESTPRWCATGSAGLDSASWFGDTCPRGIALDDLGNVYVHSDSFMARGTRDHSSGGLLLTQVNADPFDSIRKVFSDSGNGVVGDAEVWRDAPGGACLILPVFFDGADASMGRRRKHSDTNVTDNEQGELRQAPMLIVLVRAASLEVINVLQLSGTISAMSQSSSVLVMDERDQRLIVVEWTSIDKSRLLVYELADILTPTNDTIAWNNRNVSELLTPNASAVATVLFPSHVVSAAASALPQPRGMPSTQFPIELRPRGGTIKKGTNEVILVFASDDDDDQQQPADEFRIRQALVVMDRTSGTVVRWQETFFGPNLRAIASEPDGGLLLLSGTSENKFAQLTQVSMCKLMSAGIPSGGTHGSSATTSSDDSPNTIGGAWGLTNDTLAAGRSGGDADNRPVSFLVMLTLAGLGLTMLMCMCLMEGPPASPVNQRVSGKYQRIDINNLPERHAD
jgi:hypothetical protein